MNLKKYSLLLVIVLCCSLQVAADGLKDFTKEIHEQYQVRPGAKLHVENKYGAVHVDAWDKNEISIDVTIRVKTSTQSKADKLFDLISISLSGDQSEVSAITTFDNEGESTGFWDRIFGSYDAGDYEITYKISAPVQTRLDLTNKYGHIYINSDFEGDAHLTNKYGNIYAEQIDGNVQMDMGYGDIKIGDVGDIALEIKYSKAHMANANRVTINSKYSDIKLGRVDVLQTDTKYDDYEVESVNKFTNSGKYDDFLFGSLHKGKLSSKYTTWKITKATGELSMDGGYNDLQVKDTGPSLSSIEVQGKYCHVKMKISHSFTLDFDGDYVSPSLPDDFSSRVHSQDGREVHIEGRRGSGTTTAIRAQMDYGSFKILD